MVTEESVLFWTAKDESLVLSEGAILKAAVMFEQSLGCVGWLQSRHGRVSYIRLQMT